MRTSTDRNGGRLPSLTGNWVSKAFAATVKGDAEGAVDVTCSGKSTWEGNAEDLSKQQTIGLGCTDGSVHVFVTTGSAKDAGETYSVQDSRTSPWLMFLRSLFISFFGTVKVAVKITEC
ncbi:MAG: hypothetical protein Q9180_005553 [Flavoplaca navasiana]